ncbi:MAG: branched-chain amino acid ABC transporter permease [Burkholderiales bacterium]|jgi:branched-chain amino acid transport system permease protein
MSRPVPSADAASPAMPSVSADRAFRTAPIERWTPLARASVAGLLLVQGVLAVAPWILDAGAVDRLTTLFVYGILAMMWNALAGYAGLVSVGHQAFFGLGAYGAVRLADAGVDPFPALILAAVLVALLSVPISAFMLRLRGGEFAIGMWVVAALAHLLVNLDDLVQGETGTSLIALQRYGAEERRLVTYWLALATMAGLGWGLFALLRSRVGSALQAIRDNDEAAASVGVPVLATQRLVFVLSAFGCAAAGALWLATAVTFQPKTYFGVQWTAYMLFMVLVGGLGTFEGPIIGALLFFTIETVFGASGVQYLIGLGLVAVLCSLVAPQGLWGTVERRFGVQLLPVGYRVRERPGTSRED